MIRGIFYAVQVLTFAFTAALTLVTGSVIGRNAIDTYQTGRPTWNNYSILVDSVYRGMGDLGGNAEYFKYTGPFFFIGFLVCLTLLTYPRART